jgi:LCP family protein required for cell wall assembly
MAIRWWPRGPARMQSSLLHDGMLNAAGAPARAAVAAAASTNHPLLDRFALVDIQSMEQIIDTLGGVSIDSPTRLVDTQYPTDDYRTLTIDIPAGRQVMDGVTAVEYARTRHPDSDFGRQARQQQMLLAIRDQAYSSKP